MRKRKFVNGLAALLLGAGALGQALADPHISRHTVAVGSRPPPFDYHKAPVRAMPLPRSTLKPVPRGRHWLDFPGPAGASAAGAGHGRRQPVALGRLVVTEAPAPGFVSLEFGAAGHPFNISRVDNRAGRGNVSAHWPFRTVGQLFFSDGTDAFICSATLIGRGLLVTAAHCVVEFGTRVFFKHWLFVPAAFEGRAPFGVWAVAAAYVLNAYAQGSDRCAVAGIVCANDVAVLVVGDQRGAYPGDAAGWMRYGVNGAGFTAERLALVTQLGYPAAYDGGRRMQRTDSQAFVDDALANSIVWGGRQTGGSSGGPVVVNLGTAARLGEGVRPGAAAWRNLVVGVVSWGYEDARIMQQGASPFTSDNIVRLVGAACADFPAACASRR